MLHKKLSTSILAGASAVIFAFSANPVLAVTAPSFFSCLNAQTTPVIANQSGIHGVAGNTSTFTGSDSVYPGQPLSANEDISSASTVVQCLCPDNGQGIQTNWWKVSELSDEDVKVLESQGWIYIPDGSAWGLDAQPYLAQNTNFSCSNQGNTGVSNGGNGSGNSNSNNSNSGNNSAPVNASSPVQAVLGAFTQLASTGNIIFLYELFTIGIITTGTAIILRKIK